MESLLDNRILPALRDVVSSDAAFLRQELAFYLNVSPPHNNVVEPVLPISV